SFQTQIAGIIEGKCYPCHGPGGTAQLGHDYTTYQNIYDQRREILLQVFGCRMPPAGNLPPTAEERAALLAWLVCGAPNNWRHAGSARAPGLSSWLLGRVRPHVRPEPRSRVPGAVRSAPLSGAL